MPDPQAEGDALTRLVRQHVGPDGHMTVRAFAEQARDPETGTTLSKSTVGNLVQGHQIKISPAVLGAIAAGLGVDLLEVQRAAQLQYIGRIVSDPFEGAYDDAEADAVVRVAHDPERTAQDMPHVRAFIEQAAAEDNETGGA